MRAATVPFPGADGTSSSSSLHRSGISVRLVSDNACSIDTRSRGKKPPLGKGGGEEEEEGRMLYPVEGSGCERTDRCWHDS